MAFPVTFPTDPGLTNVEFALSRQTAIAQSPFTGAEQRSNLTFSLWLLSGNVPDMSGDEVAVRNWRAFILELRGQYGTFTIVVPGNDDPSTGYSGTVGTVNGADQVGTTIVTQGWTAETALLNRGDYFNLGNELKMCTSSVTTGIGGAATIDFEPEIKIPPTNGSDVIVNSPTITMRMQEDDLAWSLKHPLIYGFGFTAQEAVTI